MATFIEDLGIVSAYGEAVSKGYTGTEEEFAEMLANLPDKLAEAREYAASAAESSASAASSADGVQRNASIASTAASDAQSAAASALQSATFAETTVEGIEEHEEQCRIYRAEAVAAAEELKTTTLWNDALIDETVTGKIASFSDGCVGMPMKSIVAEITPVQSGSGDPSPTNIRPISGRTGLTVTAAGTNLLPMPITSGSYANGVTVTVNDDKSFYISKTSGSGWTTFELGTFTLPAGTYTLIESDDGIENASISMYSSSGEVVNTRYTKRRTFTLNEATTITRATFARSAAASNILTKLMLFVGSSATAEDYKPYTAQTYPVTWETEAGTIYGGTLDVVSGVLTVTHAAVDMGTLTWVGSQRFTATVQDSLKPVNGGTVPNWVCSALMIESPNGIYANTADYSVSYYSTSIIQARINDITDATAFKTAMSGVQLVYELATPQTYQLTPTEVRTILGENLVYSDADDVTVNYYVDMKGYIDKRLNTTRMMIAGVETSFVATKNYAIGDFVIVNDTLYRITAVITSGETITPGTNASETTVAEQLIALYNA